ncbi:LysR family transcriptional regulator [Acetobacter pomorum]|uniref:LysR family transcriptional regulator n=1 Tax=Acetobacter pomorum TaxID=65959 RepID=A0A2G4R7U1_9PROT|nr:LysR family transcriptional regulator [Acetobacter pomorum]PHY92619.1 LysR family transcriptional regulator [Acetobacter pomorum]GBR47247.1 LysR family transcriptional regulator [Acetobacter pomorum DSM 11825]
MNPFSRFLIYFLAVARHGSIRKASDELHIAASAIDRHILLGEQALQTPLFERLSSGMRLTAVGELFYAHANRWAKDFESLTHQIDDLKGMRRGRIDILAPEALTRVFLPDIAACLKQKYSGIVLNIHIHDNTELVERLFAGEGDLAFLLDPADLRDSQIRSILSFPLGVVSLPEHFVAKQSSVRFSVCAEYPVIVPEEPLALAVVFKKLEAVTLVNPRIVSGSNNVQMIKSLVKKGLGITILSYLDVIDEVQNGNMAFTPLTGAHVFPLRLALAHDRARPLSAVARRVADSVEAEWAVLCQKMV